MSFDEQVDDDPHGQCWAEIEHLRAELAALRSATQSILDNDGGEGSKCYSAIRLYDARQAAIAALKAAQVEQEPVAWMSRNIRPREFCDPSFLYAETAEEVANDQLAWNSEYSEPIPLYTHPAADITDERIIEIADGISGKIDVKTEW